MKRVVVFGASGETGRRIVGGALEAGHEVVAVSRSAPKMVTPHPRLTKFIGYPLDPAYVRRALAGAEVVVPAIGLRRQLNARLTVSADVMQTLIPAMMQPGMPRLPFVSAFETGPTRRVSTHRCCGR